MNAHVSDWVVLNSCKLHCAHVKEMAQDFYKFLWMVQCHAKHAHNSVLLVHLASIVLVVGRIINYFKTFVLVDVLRHMAIMIHNNLIYV